MVLVQWQNKANQRQKEDERGYKHFLTPSRLLWQQGQTRRAEATGSQKAARSRQGAAKSNQKIILL